MVKKILVSQPAPTSEKSPYFEIEKKFDVKIDFRPLIHVERLTTREFRDQRVSILDHTAIVFNSHHAIDHFFSLCKDLRVSVPEDMKYFFISEKVALYVQKYVQYRKRKIFFGKTGQWQDLIDIMAKHKKERYFVPQSDVHHLDVTQMLNNRNLIHTEAVMYRTVSTMLDKKKGFDYDMIIFFTPSGVKSLTENFPDFQQGDIRFGCFGESTAKAIEERGFRLDLKAPSAEAPSMTGALELYLERINK
ncbi:MAG: uroporphyrinogen-III synthase [Bacteroidaceae bacterium]|nr:uroporphyrinogen-III synthase [Bacteroidaceae bacterium]